MVWINGQPDPKIVSHTSFLGAEVYQHADQDHPCFTWSLIMDLQKEI